MSCTFLTLRGLSLFFKILPISNTGISAAYMYILATVHFLYPRLGSLSDMEYYFYQLAYWDFKVPKRFVGLIQMQCSPSFYCNWGQTKRLHCMSAPATPTISGFTAREMSPLTFLAIFMGLLLTPITNIWSASYC